jgi:hypothetical protein
MEKQTIGFEMESYYLPCEYCGEDVLIDGRVIAGSLIRIVHKDCLPKLERQLKILESSKRIYSRENKIIQEVM